MGPRLFSRGNGLCCYAFGHRMGRFNGAAAVQPRKSRRPTMAATQSGAASMGPRLFSRGNDLCCLSVLTRLYRFNGAAAVQPRKSGLPVNFAPKPQPASMGPRLFSRGNDGDEGGSSRNDDRASMGPRLFSRGNPTRADLVFAPLLASMGPRLFSRGNDGVWVKLANSLRRFNGAAALQPRKFGKAVFPFDVFPEWLQWGRGSSAAEIRASRGRWYVAA